jgi:hypothetical protein
MSNLHDLIKNLQVGVISTDSYVYYDKDSGKIHKISSTNTPDENFEIVAIPNKEVNPILTGEKRIDEFVIFYDVSLKQIRLKPVTFTGIQYTASNACYQLPIKNSVLCHQLPVVSDSKNSAIDDNDIVVQQDIVKKQWNILINPHTKNFLIKNTHGYDETLNFSVTSKHDPNIFYRSLECTVGDLLSDDITSIPFKYETESSVDDVSIYTAKYFDNYVHEVI